MQDRINEQYGLFTLTEKKIADYIVDYYHLLDNLTLSELSELIGVGEASIVRFTHKLGFDGFQDFKLSMALEAVKNDRFKLFKFQNDVEEATVECMRKTQNKMIESDLDKAIKLIDKADNLLFFSVGASSHAATVAESRLLRVGRKSKTVSDPHFQCMEAVGCDNHDLIIAISLTGETQDIIDSVTLAKAAGASIIAFTNNRNSTVGELADIVIQTTGEENPLNGGSFTSLMGQLFALDIMCTGYARLNPERSLESMTNTSKSILLKR